MIPIGSSNPVVFHLVLISVDFNEISTSHIDYVDLIKHKYPVISFMVFQLDWKLFWLNCLLYRYQTSNIERYIIQSILQLFRYRYPMHLFELVRTLEKFYLQCLLLRKIKVLVLFIIFFFYFRTFKLGLKVNLKKEITDAIMLLYNRCIQIHSHLWGNSTNFND